MVWKGVLLEESLEDKSLMDLVKLGRKTISRLEKEKRIMTFYNIEVRDSDLEKYLKRAKRTIKHSFYTHLSKDGEMYVIFKGKIFNFRHGDSALDKAKDYGISVGILPEQMDFEDLIKHPFGRSVFGLILKKLGSYFKGRRC